MKWNLYHVSSNSDNIITNSNKFFNKIKVNIDNFYKNHGVADPFIFNGYIFAELINEKLLGKVINGRSSVKHTQNSLRLHKGGIITVAKNKEPLIFKTILEEDFHFSYPHIFNYKDNIYMIPETFQSKELRLYKCINFPYEWKLEKILLNKMLCDSTTFIIDNYFYIFTSEVRQDKKPCDNYLMRTKDLLNDKLEIYKTNILPKNYRGGGNVFYSNNELYIPIQPGKPDIKIYGEKLLIYKIIKNNNDIKFEYNNEIVKPNDMKGIHHLSNYDNKFYCDLQN
jgi:hypothetical protein